MKWCEDNGVDYVFGLAKNSQLKDRTEELMVQVEKEAKATDEPVWRFKNLRYSTLDSWSKNRRVVAKAEHLSDRVNPRFVVSSLPQEDWPGRSLYEDLYCARGEMENRIKEQLGLFADRTSAHPMRVKNPALPCTFRAGHQSRPRKHRCSHMNFAFCRESEVITLFLTGEHPKPTLSGFFVLSLGTRSQSINSNSNFNCRPCPRDSW